MAAGWYPRGYPLGYLPPATSDLTIATNMADQLEQVPIKIPFGEKELNAVISLPKLRSWQGCGVILTHGAGGDMYHEHLDVLAKHLCNAGILCLRFTMKTPNFKYRVKSFAAVVDFLRDSEEYRINCCIIGGRSMGARVAAEIASTLYHQNKNFIIGVLCLSYPLHPPQKTTEQRLSSILPLRIPVLFLSGTKDSMCHQVLMESTLKRLNCDWSIHWIQGGDHGLTLKDRETSQTYKDVLQDLCDTVLLWTQSVFMGER